MVEMHEIRECPPLRLDFSVNLNPLGMPPAIETLLHNGRFAWDRYPDPYGDSALSAVAESHGLSPKQVLLGNGSTELFALVIRVFKPAKCAWIEPCYSGYREVCEAMGVAGGALAWMREENGFAFDLDRVDLEHIDVLFLASPNNPTGRLLDSDSVYRMARGNPGTRIILDESFLDFNEPGLAPSAMRRTMPANLIVIKSFTKFFSLPGLRLGMLGASPETTAGLRRGLLPWSLNAAALAVAPLLYQDEAFLTRSRVIVRQEREQLARELSDLDGLTVFPSSANFLYVKLPQSPKAAFVQRELLLFGILIRAYPEQSTQANAFCRLAVRLSGENGDLIRNMRAVLQGGDPKTKIPPRKGVPGESPGLDLIPIELVLEREKVADALEKHEDLSGLFPQE